MNLYAQQARNRRTTVLLFVGFALFFVLVGLAADTLAGTGVTFALAGHAWPVPVFTAIAVALATTGTMGSYFAGDRLVLGSLGARPLDASRPEERQLANVVEEVALAAGVARPTVYILPEAAPNALSTGRSPEHASIAVTEGLLAIMDRAELEAVIGHELGHVRNYDIRTMTVVAVLLGSVAILADLALSARFYRGSRRNEGSPIIAILAIVVVVLAPIVARLMAMALSRAREFEADRTGAELTRDPLALAHALAKLDAYALPVVKASAGTAHMFIADPLGDEKTRHRQHLSHLFASHPPIAQRIARLEEMGYGIERRVAAAHLPEA
jgi:heat shock protein HtpX